MNIIKTEYVKNIKHKDTPMTTIPDFGQANYKNQTKSHKIRLDNKYTKQKYSQKENTSLMNARS